MIDDIKSLNDEIIGCNKCPRLVRFRVDVANRKNSFYGQEYWSRPVPGYGDINGKILILGLAPAATGGNRTGRIFTGDRSARFLVKCLYLAGITNQPESENRNDGLIYNDSYVTAVLKCVPPADRPAKSELDNCRPYLINEIFLMKNLKAILVLGRIAFDSLMKSLREMGYDARGLKFEHGNTCDVGKFRIFCSYHPSPRNVNVGRIDERMMISILDSVKQFVYGNGEKEENL